MGLSGMAAFLGTCCMAPWVVTVLGVSGAVTLARLAVWQPYLLAIAAVLIGVAIWSVYRAPAGGAACDLASSRRMRRWVWLATVLMVVLAAISVAPIFIDFT